MASRHRSREVALQALYALDLAGLRRDGSTSAQEVFDHVAASFEVPEAAKAFAKELVCGVEERRPEIDELIARHARNWRTSRMAAVDRNLLRLGGFELLTQEETPVPVILNEAVELARRYGDDGSPAFVNGILDAMARELRGAPA